MSYDIKTDPELRELLQGDGTDKPNGLLSANKAHTIDAMLDGVIAKTAMVKNADGTTTEVPLNTAQRRAMLVKYAAEAQTEGSVGRRQKRNDPCRCGSDKKYKKCCLLKEEAAEEEAEQRAATQRDVAEAERLLNGLDSKLIKALQNGPQTSNAS